MSSQDGDFVLGQRVVDAETGRSRATVRYLGQVEGNRGQWIGVEWDQEERGKHDGTNKGIRYFMTERSGRGNS